MKETQLEIIIPNLKILINKSLTKEKSILASKDFIRIIKNLNLKKVCFDITDLIFNETISEVEFESTFNIIDIDNLLYGLYEIYKFITSKINLTKLEKNKIRKIILEFDDELDNEQILGLF